MVQIKQGAWNFNWVSYKGAMGQVHLEGKICKRGGHGELLSPVGSELVFYIKSRDKLGFVLAQGQGYCVSAPHNSNSNTLPKGRGGANKQLVMVLKTAGLY